METNILKAIINIKNLNEYDLNKIYPPKSEMVTENRIQNVGRGLETFIKDAFSNSFDKIDKIKYYSKYFSYTGNPNNPPDSMIKNGDAIEVKKIKNPNSQIQLNSSFPKNKFYAHDPLITEKCISCEQWQQKDMLYAIGIIEDKKTHIESLALIYGDCFAADETVYLKIKNKLVDTIKDIPDSEKTNELGRINRVDPLGVTKLRIRGMWLLENPYKIFNNIFKYDSNKQLFSLISLMTKSKFNSFPNKDKKVILKDEEIIVKEVKIQDPNNPVDQIEAIYIRFDVK